MAWTYDVRLEYPSSHVLSHDDLLLRGLLIALLTGHCGVKAAVLLGFFRADWDLWPWRRLWFAPS